MLLLVVVLVVVVDGLVLDVWSSVGDSVEVVVVLSSSLVVLVVLFVVVFVCLVTPLPLRMYQKVKGYCKRLALLLAGVVEVVVLIMLVVLEVLSSRMVACTYR